MLLLSKPDSLLVRFRDYRNFFKWQNWILRA
jgi:hypothetical protein